MTNRNGKGVGAISAQRGFTLLELVVGLGLMAVILGVSTPAISTMRSRYVLDGASRQLAMEISKARMQAIAQNRTMRIRMTGPRTYVVESSENGSTWQASGESVTLPYGVGVWFGTSGMPRFNRQGLAPASTTIFIANRAGTKTIQTSMVGRVTRS